MHGQSPPNAGTGPEVHAPVTRVVSLMCYFTVVSD